MLTDIQFRQPDFQTSLILGIIGAGGPVIPERIGEGMYLSGHWSIDQLVDKKLIRDRFSEQVEAFKAGKYGSPSYEEYGVCDTPEQVLEKYPFLKDAPERFFISYVRIDRGSQPRDGGWRWHKWGTYIGDREPKCEYLHDEPDIETVYTFHIYELR